MDRSSLPIKIQTIRAKKKRRNDWRRKAKNLMNFETDFILGNEAFKIIQSWMWTQPITIRNDDHHHHHHYSRGRPRSRFMPPPADKQIAQNPHHSWGLSAYYSPKCIYTPKIQNLLITVQFSTEVIVTVQISLGYACALEFIGLRPGIYWATPWSFGFCP